MTMENNMDICRICGRPAEFIPLQRTVNSVPLEQCLVCGTVQAEYYNEPSPAQLYDRLFGGDTYQQHRETFEHLQKGRKPYRPYESWLLKKAEKWCPGRKLVEIGGGIGAFGLIAQARGWEYQDMDVSETAVQFAKSLGVHAKVMDCEVPEIARASSDLVVMWEVIEHIWNVAEYLGAIRKGLHSNGVLLLSTPNFLRSCYQETDEWGASGPPIHVNFFTPQSLHTVLSLAGFQVVQIHQRRIWRPNCFSPRGLIKAGRLMLGIEAPPTLYVFAFVNSEQARTHK